jgi:hypothetical protein
MDLGDIPRDQHSLEVGRPTLRRLTMHDAMNRATPSHAVWFRICRGLERGAGAKIVSMNQGARDLPVGLRAGRRCASSLIARETPSSSDQYNPLPARTATCRFQLCDALQRRWNSSFFSRCRRTWRHTQLNRAGPLSPPSSGARDACSSTEIDELAQRHAGIRLPKDAPRR